jgi:hypothetical protein
VRDEHNAILSLPSRDLKVLALRTFAATVLGSNLDFLSRGDFVVFVLHCKQYKISGVLLVFQDARLGNWGRRDAESQEVQENVGRRINAQVVGRMRAR